MNDNLRELGFEELDAVAGGRIVTDNEGKAIDDFVGKVMKKKEKLLNEGRVKEAEALQTYALGATISWVKAIHSAPEGSPDIPLSDYILLNLDE